MGEGPDCLVRRRGAAGQSPVQVLDFAGFHRLQRQQAERGQDVPVDYAAGKWRSMSNEKLYESKMLLGALYRNELAAGLSRLGYGIDKTHADGRFEIAGVSRGVVEAFSTRRTEIQAAMAERNLGSSADNPRLAERAALMTRSAKRDIDRDELTGKDGQSVPWQPEKIGARSGGVEVYKREEMELRAGDCIRWTRNDTGLGLVNSQTAEVAAVRDGTVSFRLGDGRMLDLNQGDAQLRHVDRAWASTVHAFQGCTVDTVIAAMEANHPNLTTQKTLYVEISRARDKAELVTDDKAALREQLEAATGERIAALEAVEPEKAKGLEAGLDAGESARREDVGPVSQGRQRTPEPAMEQSRAPKSLDRDLGL